MKRMMMLTAMFFVVSCGSWAKVDLSTLPERQSTQLTIYNSADLTLVRENRPLTLKEGENRLQFSWANTLIDPTSLEMLPKAHAGEIDIMELTYPPRVRNLGLWSIKSEVSGKVPVEITYLTSGLTWRAFYMGTLTEDEKTMRMGTLTEDEKTMRLQGYVRVTNNSGEDYENAQTRLIVGKVHILDRIADLARRQHPYGSPLQRPVITARAATVRSSSGLVKDSAMTDKYAFAAAIKEVKKEGLSEYFLYTIEGTETIPNGWSKRLPSFDVDAVPVVNLYKFIPGGLLKVYRSVDDRQHLAYTGQSSFKYIPVDEDVELNLGAVSDVVVEAKLMNYKTENYRFNSKRDISGWDEVRTFRIKVRNTRDIPVKLEIKRNFNTSYWDLENISASTKRTTSIR